MPEDPVEAASFAPSIRALDDLELCQAWARSYQWLEGTHSLALHAYIASLRQAYLDEMDRRVSAVAYFRVADAIKSIKSIIAIETLLRPSTKLPVPPCARWSASTPWTRHCPKPTASTSTSISVKSSMS